MSNPLDTGSSFQHQVDLLALAPAINPPHLIGEVGSWGQQEQRDFRAEDFPRLGTRHTQLVAPLRGQSDSQLESILANFLNLMMTGTLGEAMVRRFMNGSGQEYIHAMGSYLSGATLSSETFSSCALTAKSRIETSLRTQAGSPGGQPALIDYQRIRIRAPQLNFEYSRAAAMLRVLTGAPSPDLVLKCLIGGTHGTRVYLGKFAFNFPTRDYAARVRFEIYDNFGVDETDLYTVTAPYGNALIAFWVLQHERYGHRPFVNRISAEFNIRGTY